jgi:hypothetical protein
VDDELNNAFEVSPDDQELKTVFRIEALKNEWMNNVDILTIENLKLLVRKIIKQLVLTSKVKVHNTVLFNVGLQKLGVNYSSQSTESKWIPHDTTVLGLLLGISFIVSLLTRK